MAESGSTRMQQRMGRQIKDFRDVVDDEDDEEGVFYFLSKANRFPVRPWSHFTNIFF